MFGIEQVEVLLLLRQLGLALAGSAAFWGSVFLFLSRKSKNREAALWQGAAQNLLWLFFPALFFYGVVWTTLAVTQCAFCAYAHEGISIAMDKSLLAATLQRQIPFVALLLSISFILFSPLTFFRGRRLSLSRLSWGYGFFFISVSFLMLYPWQEYASLREWLSTTLHSWHSILTLGSVIVVDFLYTVLRHNLKVLLPRIFSLITKAIWVGLGLDFLSAGLVFNEAFAPSDKLLFMQTLIGIIIINGVFLSGPLARALFSDFFQLQRIIGISGPISLAGWLSITTLDGFQSLTLSYVQLALLYIAFVLLIFIGHQIVERIIAPQRTL